MTTIPDNWRPPGASNDPRWEVITRAILAVDSRTAYSSYNVAAEQEAVRDVNEMLERLSGGDAAEGADEENPPRKWLVNTLRNLARDLLADPKTPWIGERDPKQHICWAAADLLETAPSKPAPDAMRKALVTEIRNHVAWTMCSEETVDLFDRIVKTLSAPVPSPDGAGDRKDFKLRFTSEWLREKIAGDPDLPCEAGRLSQPRFFIDHGLIHDRVTGKHVVTNGEPPFEDSIEQVCELLNSLALSPSATGAAEPDAVREELAKAFWVSRGGPPENFDKHLSGKFVYDYPPFVACMKDANMALSVFRLTPDLGLTIAQMEHAAKACRDKYCELMSGKRAWAELTDDERSIDMVSLSAAFSAVSFAPAVGVTREAIANVARNFVDSALRWQPVFEDGRGGNDLTLDQTADLICERLAAALSAAPARAALAAALSDQVVGWQPIETAPKDGTRISLFAEGCLASGEGVVIGHWYVHPNIAGWITDAFDCGDYEFNPTHWQPLPTPPQPSEDNGPDTNGGER